MLWKFEPDLYCVGYSTSELRNACDLAMSALKKQLNGGWIPFKEVETKKIKKNSCLVCGELIENHEIVCPACKMMAYE